MNKYALIAAFSCGLSLPVFSQKYDYQWPFGDGHNFDTGFGISRLDFNNGQVTVSTFAETDPEMNNGGSFICDENGSLMLMTNNCAIYDHNFQVIPGGDSLTPGPSFNTFCAFTGDYPAGQSSLFLPAMDNDSLFYLLHKDSELSDALQDVVSYRFYLSVVVRKQDGTFYVREKKLLLQTHMVVNRLTACLHHDGMHWWTWVAGYDTNKFYKFLIGGPETVQGPFIQQIGIPLINQELDIGQAAFSPDTKYLAINNEAHGVMLYRFDHATGLLSDPRTYAYPNMVLANGLVFSLNSSLIYVTTNDHLYQMDISDTASVPIITHIDSIWTVDDYGWPVGLGAMYIGPDCRIYISPATTSNYIHVIHRPNEKGLACQFEAKAVRTPTRVEFDLPNLPMYRFGGNCDSTILWGITGTKAPVKGQAAIKIFPNPASGFAAVVVPADRPYDALIAVDLLGREVRRIDLVPGQTEAEADVSGLAPGVYFLVPAGVPGAGVKFVVHR